MFDEESQASLWFVFILNSSSTVWVKSLRSLICDSFLHRCRLSFLRLFHSVRLYYAACVWEDSTSVFSLWRKPRPDGSRRHSPTSQLCRDAADRNEREDLWRAGRGEPVQRGEDLQAVASDHRAERAAVEEAVPDGPSHLPEGGRQRPETRPLLEGS